MHRSAVLALLAVILLSGCIEEKIAKQAVANQALVEATGSRVAQAPDCCASNRQMRFDALQRDVRQPIVLGASSPVHSFAFGKSRFAAFALPPLGPGDELVVGAIDVYSGASAKPIFHPAVILLSATYEPLPEQPAVVTNDHFTGWSTTGHAAHIPLTPQFAAAKYVVVAADPSYVGRAFKLAGRSDIVPAGGAYVPISIPGQAFPYGYEGQGFVELKTGR